MADFMDDVEPAADLGSRSGTPFGGRFNASANDQASGSGGDKRRQLSPEPDEDLDLSEGKINMWLVKAPKFLIEAWGHVKEKDQQLGVVRVYNPDATGHQRMELILHGQDGKQGLPIPIPPGTDLPSHLVNIPRRYDLRMHTSSAGPRNLYGFKESALDADSSDDEDEDDEDGGNASDSKGKGKRKGAWAVKSAKKGKRTPALVGTITSELSAAPQIAAPTAASSSASAAAPKLTDEYREILRRRKLEASQPKRTVKMLDAEDLGKRNMLAAGVGLGYSKAKTGTLIAPKAKASATEKFARMPRNELLDLLFSAFDRYPYWSLRGLREHTQQPEAYLREVLSDVADLHRKGPYNGNWSLKPSFANARQAQAEVDAQQAQVQAAAQSQQASGSGSAPGTQQTEDADEPDEEDLEDVEM